jgi:hypothetical protein
LLAGASAKKLVRGSGWKQEDFYLGIELTLAAMSAALVHIFDLARRLAIASEVAGQGSTLEITQQLAVTGTFIAVTFLLFLVVLTIHQDWTGETQRKAAQLVRLGGVSNLIGSGLLATFVVLVK